MCMRACVRARIVSLWRFDVRRVINHSEFKHSFCERAERDV
jgi:hypothetical protein